MERAKIGRESMEATEKRETNASEFVKLRSVRGLLKTHRSASKGARCIPQTRQSPGFG